MAQIDPAGAHWSSDGRRCQNQCTTRIAELQRCSIILQKEMENNNVKSNQAKTIGILSQSTQQQQQQQAQQQQMHDTIDRALESSSYQHSSASSHSHPLENGAGGCRRIASMATDDTQSHMQNPKQNMPMDDGADDRTKAPPIDGNDDATIGKDAVANARSNNRKGDVYAVERSSSPATIGSSGQKVECGGNEDAVTSANNKKCNLISSDIRNNPFDGPNATTVENFSVITGATAYQSNLVSASTNPFRICSYCSRCNQLIEQCLCDTQTNNSIRKYSTKIDEVAERSAMVPQTPPSSPQAEQPTFSSEQPKALDVSSIKNISKPNHVTHTSTSCSSSSSNSSKVIASNATASENRLVSSRLAYLPPHIRNLPKTQSLDLNDEEMPSSLLAQQQSSFDHNRTIYPNVPFSPYGSPFGSPRVRRRPLRESRRISMERCGSFLQLNQYKLMDQIGQGSYGLVKLAYSEEDSTHYAMKILSKRKLLRKAGLMGRGPKKGVSPLDRVYREIAVLKKLDHQNVVKLVEVLDDPLEDSLYLVFELLQNGEVLSLPTAKPLTEERAWAVFRDALLGLEYLHYQRIIHSDIKPDNLLLDECGIVKIADLGVCNEFLGEDASMNNCSTVGTPAFRAPETLVSGQLSYSGKAADIWALGATLYSLVFGNVPFVANNVPAVYEKIKNDSLKFPEHISISDELRNLITRMLDKDPAQRINLPQIKEHPWVTWNGKHPLPSEEENCRLVQVNDDDINSVVKSIPKLDTLILIKTMLKKHSFQNPFTKTNVSGRAPQRGGSRLERFTRAGRSNSAPGAYHMIERTLSGENLLPSVSESVVSPGSDTSNDINNAP